MRFFLPRTNLRFRNRGSVSTSSFRLVLSRGPIRSYSSLNADDGALEQRIEAIPIERFRNFCIVAHIDHGKSTLSDRLLEYTGVIGANKDNKQILDKLDVERQRGITVKAQTCSMLYKHKDEDYLLHLVDTPGHVDFREEVMRSYASCGGALLLIDASKGVQAQTVSNFHMAFAEGLTLIPVINKVDLPIADVPLALEQIKDNFELNPDSALLVSARNGHNIESILPRIIEDIPAPIGDESLPLRLLVVDSWYDNYKGVIMLVRIFDGKVRAGDKLVALSSGAKHTAGQVGIQYPDAIPQAVLRAGQVGYVFFNPAMKNIKDAQVGDTFTFEGKEDAVDPFPGFTSPKPMVFVAAFPADPADHSRLAESIGQLVLNDRSVFVRKTYSNALGSGWRLGFLGSLHCIVFEDRLKQEHGGSIIITEPSVPTKIQFRDGTEILVDNPAEFPSSDDPQFQKAILSEPYMLATITLPDEYLGRVIELLEDNRGEQKGLEYFHTTTVILKYLVPACHLVDDLFGKLKAITKGYATLDYEEADYRVSDMVKLQLLVNKIPVDAICRVVHSSQAQKIGKVWVEKFKNYVDRQLFEVVIQAAAGNQIVARATLAAYRKDVLAKLHASDASRRKKLLDKQKEGRKKLQTIGSVTIDHSAFQQFLSRN